MTQLNNENLTDEYFFFMGEKDPISGMHMAPSNLHYKVLSAQFAVYTLSSNTI